MLSIATVLATGAAAHTVAPGVVARQHVHPRAASAVMMPKKPKKDERVWLPPRTSAFAREVDVALQLVSRAAAAATKEDVPCAVANLAVTGLVADGLASEFPKDVLIASTAERGAETQKMVLDLVNEFGATTPCVNSYDPPYPVPVAPTELTEEALQATLERSGQGAIGPRTWVLAPLTEAEQPAISLSLLEFGQPVVCAVALPKLPRTSMDAEKLLRMTVSFDGQCGAVPEPVGTIMWAEEGIGSYERSVGGEHGTDVRIRVDRSLLGRRNIATGQVVGVQDFAEVTRCESAEHARATTLASDLGIAAPPLQAGGPFCYGLVARGEAQTYFELPDRLDRAIWSHVAGALLVKEAGGLVTDTSGNALDFSLSAAANPPELPAHVVGTIATNRDLHPDVLQKLGVASSIAAMA